MAVLPSPISNHKFYQADGVTPAAAYEVYTYAAGTATPLATYSDAAGVSANTNPIILNANGEASIYVTAGVSYDLVLKYPGGGAQVGATQRVIVDGDTALRADLADGSANAGAFLVKYTRAGTGAVETDVRARIISLSVTPEEFGAVGDGTTDDYLAIRRAIDAAQAFGSGWSVEFGRKTYAFATPLVIQNTDVHLVGKGGKHPAYNGAPAADGTTLKYTGSAGQTAVKMTHMIGEHGISGINIDCNSLANVGLDVCDVYYGRYEDVSVRNCTGTALRTGLSNDGATNFNTFCRISLDAIGSGRVGLHVTGVGSNNTAHNVFTMLQINYGDTGVGLKLGYSDNNTFNMTFINRVSGASGNGVLVVPAEEPLFPGFPESNYFFHLQSGQDGWVQPSGSPINYVFGYDRSNGQPLPVLNGTILVFTEGQNYWLGSEKFVKDANTWSSTTGITVTANSGTITTVGTKECRYLVRGKTVYFNIRADITTNGTGAGFISIGSLPFTAGGSSGMSYIATGRATGGAGAIMGTLNQGTSSIAVQTYAGGYPGADGVILYLSGVVEIN